MYLIFSMMKKMQKASQRTKTLSWAFTLIEVIVAMAIMVIVFAAIIPQLRAIRNSWASAREGSELVQTGRALLGHATCELSQAIRITSVSDPNETNGFIEFINNDGDTVRYDIAASNFVEFGQPGSMSELAGPVSGLQFICYDTRDFNTPITDANSIRFVETVVTATDPTGILEDKTFSSGVYIRTNPLAWLGADPNALTVGTSYWIDSGAYEIAICRIDQNHYLLAYGRYGEIGHNAAFVLTVDPDTGLVFRNGRYCAVDDRGNPALCKIDDTHYLRAYGFWDNRGGAAVLTVNPVTWEVTEGPHHEYTDGARGDWPALSQIDSTHYLCTYDSTDEDAWAVVLTVNPANWTIGHGTPFEFEDSPGVIGVQTCLQKLDDTHQLCVYRSDHGKAVVLTVGSASDSDYEIVVRAKGVVGDEHVNLIVSGSTIADWTLTKAYKNYSASASDIGGIGVCFDNDDAGSRDVQVDYIQVDGVTRQAEDQSYNSGVWQDGSCGGSYSEWLHCNGCIGFSGITSINVRAKGAVGGEHINLTVGGSTIADWTLSTSYQNYFASTINTGGINVCFDNDDGAGRDVQVDYIQVNGVTRQAEAQPNNSGVWQNSSCGGSYSEWLHCNGCIDFGGVSGSGGGWTITQEDTLDLAFFNWYRPGLCRIYSTHFLATYNKYNNIEATVLTVDPNDWSISDTSPVGIVPHDAYRPCVIWLNGINYVCSYKYVDGSPSSGGYVVPLQVQNGSWITSKGTDVQVSTGTEFKSVLSRIDDKRVLCVYVTETADLYATVITYGEIIRP
jgi:type II secretory pathway pseudopilin PulG